MTIIPKARKNLNSLTALEREKEIKRLRGETEELIDEMGQVSEKKALPTVRRYAKEREEVDNLQFQEDVEMLKYFSDNKKNYQRYLLTVLQRFVREEGIPKKYVIYAESTDIGIVLGIEKTNYMGAFKTCGVPFYDINACKILSVQLGNTIGRLEGHFKTTDSGIVLPEKGDLEIAKTKYGRRTSKSRA